MRQQFPESKFFCFGKASLRSVLFPRREKNRKILRAKLAQKLPADAAGRTETEILFPSRTPTTAIAAKPRSPSDIALHSAVLSAQQVGEKEALSTLQPVYIRPDFASSAAPTRNPE